MTQWSDELTEEVEWAESEEPDDWPVATAILAGVGALLIVIGAACIYWPAGIIAAGICALGGSLLAYHLR